MIDQLICFCNFCINFLYALPDFHFSVLESGIIMDVQKSDNKKCVFDARYFLKGIDFVMIE